MSFLKPENYRRHFIRLMAVYLILMLAIVVGYAYAYAKTNNGITLQVTSRVKDLNDYKRHELSAVEYYISGIQGDVRLKPKSIVEAMLLSTLTNTMFDFFDIIGAAVVFGMVFYMFKDSQNVVVFSQGMTVGFIRLALVIALTAAALDLGRMLLGEFYVPYVTHGRFAVNYNFKVISFSYLIYPVFIFLMRIPQKGLELQNEAELTI